MVQPTRVKLGCGQPYPAQVAFLARRGTKATGYTETHLKAGLSAGKTLAEALKAWFSVTKWNPGVPGLITFPEYKYTWQTSCQSGSSWSPSGTDCGSITRVSTASASHSRMLKSG